MRTPGFKLPITSSSALTLKHSNQIITAAPASINNSPHLTDIAMRFIVALALSLSAVVTAAPGASHLAARQLCTVDCRCLTSTGVPTFPNTERCCVPPAVVDIPVSCAPKARTPYRSWFWI
jgi:hypothetical protein